MAGSRRRGRPPLDADDRSVQMNVTLPGKMFDQLYRRSQVEPVTMAETARRILRRTIDPPHHHEPPKRP